MMPDCAFHQIKQKLPQTDRRNRVDNLLAMLYILKGQEAMLGPNPNSGLVELAFTEDHNS